MLDLNTFLLAALTAVLAAIPPCILAWRNGRKTEQVHQAVNSRMDELLGFASSASRAEGVIEGVNQQKQEGGG